MLQKRVVARGKCYNPALVRDKRLGSAASVKHVFWLGKDNCKTRREAIKFCDLMLLILEVWR